MPRRVGCTTWGFAARRFRNTLANANATRPWQIYADFAQHLIGLARPLYLREPFGRELDATVYAFDASSIDLCLSVFAPGRRFARPRRAIKLHTLLDLHGNIPSFIHITDGKTHETQAFFVTRAKSNTKFKRRYSR